LQLVFLRLQLVFLRLQLVFLRLQLVFLRLQKVSEMGATTTGAKSKPVQPQPMVRLQLVAVRFGSGLFPVLWTGL
jgi:hypothetical protein